MVPVDLQWPPGEVFTDKPFFWLTTTSFFVMILHTWHPLQFLVSCFSKFFSLTSFLQRIFLKFLFLLKATMGFLSNIFDNAGAFGRISLFLSRTEDRPLSFGWHVYIQSSRVDLYRVFFLDHSGGHLLTFSSPIRPCAAFAGTQNFKVYPPFSTEIMKF